MKKTKRILAITGVILLAVLYLSTLVFALMGKDFFQLFMVSIICSVMIPVLIWAYTLVYRLVKKQNEEEEKD